MSIEITPWFFVALAVWLVTSVTRNVYYILMRRRPGEGKSKGVFALIMIVMFLMWAAWAFMSLSDPVKLTFIGWPRYIGAALFVIGLGLFIYSDIAKRGVGEGRLVTTGIYSVLRHPMYVGQGIMALGLPILGRGLVTLCLASVWIGQMIWWAVVEEKAMAEKYPEYAEYKKKTWF